MRVKDRHVVAGFLTALGIAFVVTGWPDAALGFGWTGFAVEVAAYLEDRLGLS